MFWIVISIVTILWWVAGTADNKPNNNGQPKPQGGSGSDCNSCNSIKSYYNGLSRWQKIKKAIWYGLKVTDCWLRGCKI